jgi:hypothetical protein
MIKPTIGRVLHFYPRGSKPTDRPLLALVAHVWSDTCVNLAVFDANGGIYQDETTSVLLVQEGAEVPTGGNYAVWPSRACG